MTALVERVSARAAGMRPAGTAAHVLAWGLGRIGWLAFRAAVLVWKALAGVLKVAGWAAFWCWAAVLTGWEDAATAARQRREAGADGDAALR